MSKMMTGKRALLETLKSESVGYIFGNPGTSEGPIIDILGDYPEIKYILTLQESVAVGMGESYARATGKAAFVMLHVDSGLANGIALMLDAYCMGTPLVVASASYDARKIAEGKTDLAELVRPVTKWSVELNLPDQIPGVMRRAFNEANSHPKGPVYVGFSSNALEGSAEMDIVPSSKKYDAFRPDIEGIEKAAMALINAENPVMLLGDRVSDDGALEDAVALAELLALPVYQIKGGEVSFPTKHDQFFGLFNLRTSKHRKVLEEVDLVLAIGMEVFDELFYWGDVILEPKVTLIHIDNTPGRIGKTEPTRIGIISHCGRALEELVRIVEPKLSPIMKTNIKKRRRYVKSEVVKLRNDFDNLVKKNWDNVPMAPERMMYELAKALPYDAIVVDDSFSHRSALRRCVGGARRGDIRGVRGQSIGGGIGATMGTQCANPDRVVIGVIGDGSAMMTIQGLWTAANDNIPCIFVICNNGMYRILKVNFDIYKRQILKDINFTQGNLPYSDFQLPFNLASIATSMGIHGERIVDPNEIKPAIERAISSRKPTLLDMIIDGSL